MSEKKPDVLMLEQNAHLNYLVFENEHSKLVNALSYIDEKYDDDPKVKAKVNALIRHEMRSMEDKDYLEKLPLPKLSHLVSSKTIDCIFRNLISFNKRWKE